MLVDTSQRGNILSVSYTNDEGGIDLEQFDIQATNGVGIYDYAICDEDDPQKEPILRHYKGKLPIKKVSSWKFDFDELREFLVMQIPKEKKEKIFKFNSPGFYMCDIEIAMSDDDSVFPNPQEAKYVIDSIQITSPEMRTVTITCNPRVKHEESQILVIEDMINDHYKDIPYVWELVDRLVYSHIVFETETEMLEFFWQMVRDKLHAVSFWNGARFDVPYLVKRCEILKIDMGMGSPTGEISHFNSWPKHRYVFDYMILVDKWAFDLYPLLSVGLGHVMHRALNIGKLEYDGSYRDLYNGDIHRFMAYGAIDTISMQLLHQKKKYTYAKDALVFYTKTSLYDASKVTSQVHAMIWDELYETGLINAVDFKKHEKTPYDGGYVKSPVRKFVMFPVCVDFSALYPRVAQSHNISFDNYVRKVTDAEKKELVIKGEYVSVNNNYYKNDKDYTLRIIFTKLLAQRYDYKDLMSKTFLQTIPNIEAEMKRRNMVLTN